MAHKDKFDRLAKVKQALAEKYEHLATIAGSRPKQKAYTHRARNLRRQADEYSKM